LKTNDYASGSLGFKTGNNKWGWGIDWRVYGLIP
jgi:hypothetical protein